MVIGECGVHVEVVLRKKFTKIRMEYSHMC